jgi:phage terminase large subunit
MELSPEVAEALESLPEDVREAMLADMTAEVTRRRRVRRSSQKHVFRGAAKVIQEAEDPEILISGPVRTGKSLAVLHKVHDLLSSFDRARGLIVRKTRASLTQTGLQTYEDDVLGPGNPISEGPQRSNRTSYRYPNGSEFVIGGMDKASRIMSSEYDIIFVQEATELTEDEWEMLGTRLSGNRLPHPQLIGDCNPSYPQHWLKRRESEGHLVNLVSHLRDNPIFFDDGGNLTKRGEVYMERLKRLTGVRKQRMVDGLWVAAEGAIYPEWSDDRNRCNWFEPPPDWRRFLVVDFGFTNPLVGQWWAVDPDERLYRYREFYHTKTLVEDFAEVVKSFPDYWLLEAIVCDHDAEDRATLERHLNNKATMPAEKDVSPGIQLVQSLIRGTEGQKLGQIVLMRDALIEVDADLQEVGKPTCTEDEIPSYVWLPDNKEAPLKVDDHGCDAMRYASMYGLSNGSAEDWVIKPH